MRVAAAINTNPRRARMTDTRTDAPLDEIGGQSAMAVREQRVMELLKSTKPERIEHDLRNVLNELSLLRVLFDRMEEKDPTPDR